ncbi:MAG: Z1 domain-containing protein, partial [Parasphingorhabdus sp.]
ENHCGLNVIAVGGDKLARGLTLEGLSVSYFLRCSRMYDTLMQMGRWFGYRPRYDDLCRVWMPEEAEGWYAHIAEAIEELREELRVMQAAGATPEQFGLKVRSHPDSLIVTARNKMGSGESFRVAIGLGKSFIETAILRHDEASREANRQAAQHFVAQLAQTGRPVSGAEEVGGSWLLHDVSPEPIMDFISAFRNHPASIKTDPQPVRRYIEERQDGELAKWDVLFTGIKSGDDKGLQDRSLGIPINCQRRMEGGDRAENRRAGRLPVTNKQRVASRGVEKTGLTTGQIETAERNYRAQEGKENFPDRIYREVRERPLLIVHLLAIGDEGDDLSAHKPTVAWSISFPKTEMEDKRVEYVVNTTWWKDNYGDEVEDEEMGGDND